MQHAILTREVTFSAAHRYHRPEWSAERNRAVFGPCNNPVGHGHSYRLCVAVAGVVDGETGFAVDLAALDALLRRTVADPNADEYFRFTAFYTALHNFCAVDLSAFYFDIRKDSLYCDRPDTLRRRATRTVMDQVFNCLTAWLAPVLCFTAEEAWLTRHPNGDSVHLRLFPEVPAGWCDEALSRKWDQIRDVRRVVTGALELARADKKIGSSLQAAPVLFTEARYDAALEGLDLDEISITSGLERQSFGSQPPEHFALADVPGVAVAFRAADGGKCERCWRVLPEVGKDKSHPSLCIRCSDAVEHLRSAAE